MTVRSISGREETWSQGRQEEAPVQPRGEISEAPPVLCATTGAASLPGANKPNEFRDNHVPEFRIPAGKVYLSPIVDCFDGTPLSCVDIDLARRRDGQLVAARRVVPGEGDYPKIRSTAAITAGRMDKDMR